MMPQGFGSTLTYARRYSLAAALGLAQEDDDGNSACAPEPKQDFKAKNTEQKPKAQPQATGDKFVKITPQGDVIVTVASGHDENGRPLAAYKTLKS